MKTHDELDDIRKFSAIGGYCRTATLAAFLDCTAKHIRDLCLQDRLVWTKIPGKRSEYLILRASVIEMFERGDDGATTQEARAGRHPAEV